MAAARRICLVTGGNKGIGRSICKLLAREPNHHIILTARNESLGAAAVEELAYPNIEFMQLDITSHESRERLSHEIQGKFGKIDVLINNAGIAFKGNSWGEEVARKTLDTNYFATLQLTQRLIPLMRDGGHVVMVSSIYGILSILKDNLKPQFLSPSLTLEQLNALANQFVADVANDTYEKNGWPRQSYGVSKVCVSAMTRVLAKQHPNLYINACCPGFVRTDMSSQGDLGPDEGAETPCWLASPDFKQTGGFWREKKLVNWEEVQL